MNRSMPRPFIHEPAFGKLMTAFIKNKADAQLNDVSRASASVCIIARARRTNGEFEKKTLYFFVVSVRACLAISLSGSIARILFQYDVEVSLAAGSFSIWSK